MDHQIRSYKKRRQKLGITQTGLAKEAGVSQSLIAKIEAGMIDPAYSKAIKIGNTLERLEKKDEPKAKDLMCKKAYTAKPEEKITRVIKRMKTKAISQMPVMQESVIGMITEKAILENIGDRDIRKLKVEHLIEDMPPIVGEETPISTLNRLLKDNPLVVVGKMGKIKGVVTKSDIIGSMV